MLLYFTYFTLLHLCTLFKFGTWYNLNIIDFTNAVWRNGGIKLHHWGVVALCGTGGVKTFHYVILKSFVLFGIGWFSLTSPRMLQM